MHPVFVDLSWCTMLPLTTLNLALVWNLSHQHGELSMHHGPKHLGKSVSLIQFMFLKGLPSLVYLIWCPQLYSFKTLYKLLELLYESIVCPWWSILVTCESQTQYLGTSLDLLSFFAYEVPNLILRLQRGFLLKLDRLVFFALYCNYIKGLKPPHNIWNLLCFISWIQFDNQYLEWVCKFPSFDWLTPIPIPNKLHQSKLTPTFLRN